MHLSRAWFAAFAAATLGAAIGWVDSGPHWDDTGVTAMAILLVAFGLALLEPRRPWRWALLVGLAVPAVEVPRTGALAAFVAVGFALFGCALGAALRAG